MRPVSRNGKYVRRACEYCKKSHRKWDEQATCKNCQSNGSKCVRKPSTTKRGPKKHNKELDDIDTSNNDDYDDDDKFNNIISFSHQEPISSTSTTLFLGNNYHPINALNNDLFQQYPDLSLPL